MLELDARKDEECVNNDFNDDDYEPKKENGTSDSDEEQGNNAEKDEKTKQDETLTENDINHGNITEGRKRSITAQPDKWAKNSAKRSRMEGKAYMGYSRTKEGKVKQNVPKEARKMGSSCKSKECLRVKSRNCSEINDVQRNAIFTKFWSEMNWDQRKVFVINHIEKTVTKRTYTKSFESRRKYSLKYFLTINMNKVQVCKQMFLQTLAIGEYSVHDWVQKGCYGMTSSFDLTYKSNKRTTRQDKVEDKRLLKEFFDCLPKLPSHYGRSNSSKLYLETVIRSLNQLFKLYEIKCKEENKVTLSRTIFSKMFYSMNLSIHPIKKDKCDLCTKHEVGQLSDKEWNTHRRKKERAREEKKRDKEEAKMNKKGRVLTMDLQAVKVCPYVQASTIFFKLKLCCHNFTVYNVVTHEAKCFWFSETEADMTASTFASCIMEYLTTDCQNESGPIIIYSDGCTYQNRNNIIANALLNYSVNNNIEIIQKFLEVGHTQMECDSVHSCIERKLKGRDIHLPSDYLRITKEARMKPFPYEVKCMQYFNFKDYSIKKYQRYASIRPGKVTNDPVVTDIRALQYLPNGNIYYKLDFDDEWRELPQRQKPVSQMVEWPQMYKEKRKIKFQKWQHLQLLKSVIPTDCHSFYDSLKHDSE
nr:uncharacterized protein LOC111413475 [Onthophagus taurus]XP_022905178.1 uncharacterized protein LOC111417195 [Onthophagus taurus]XP_022907172.1 uncharacterized protein LOC111418744 [Onthophagus taurus]